MMKLGSEAVATLSSYWTSPEKPIETLDDVAQAFITIDVNLEAAAHAVLAIWQAHDDPGLVINSLTKKIQSCQTILSKENKELLDIQDDQKLVVKWKQLSDLEVKQLLFKKQLEVLVATLEDLQYKSFVTLFRKGMHALKAQKNSSAGDRIREFQKIFGEVEAAVNQGRGEHSKAVLREGVLFLRALHASVESSNLDESQLLDTLQTRFQNLLKGQDTDEGYEEEVENKMRELSLGDSTTLEQLLVQQSRQVTLKSGRYFVGWNFLAGHNYPHIISAVKKTEEIAKKLQGMEELLAMQIPKICRGELFTGPTEGFFYEKKLINIKADLAAAKKELYQGNYPAEMKAGLAYFSRIEVLVRHVGFASQFFSDLSQNYMQVAAAQERLMKYLYREDLQFLDLYSPQRTFFAVQDLYQAYSATLPLCMTKETSSFQVFKNERIASIQKMLDSRGKITVRLNKDEEELKQLIVNGEKVSLFEEKKEQFGAIRIKTLLTKMIIDYLAFTGEGQRDTHSIIAVLLFISMKQRNAELLKTIRDGDLQFAQLLDVFGLTRPITLALSKLETGQNMSENQLINMILKGNLAKISFTQNSKITLIHQLEERAPFSQILKRLFK